MSPLLTWVAGALITALYLGKLPGSREALRPTLKSVVSFAVYNLFIGAASGFVNNAAHVGGLLMGLALGAVLGQGHLVFLVERPFHLGANLFVVVDD